MVGVQCSAVLKQLPKHELFPVLHCCANAKVFVLHVATRAS